MNKWIPTCAIAAAFAVSVHAQDSTVTTRTQVKDAIETLYDVRVERVNIVNTSAKRGRRLRSRRLLVRKPGYKKAIVTLVAGQTLEIFEGVQ